MYLKKYNPDDVYKHFEDITVNIGDHKDYKCLICNETLQVWFEINKNEDHLSLLSHLLDCHLPDNQYNVCDKCGSVIAKYDNGKPIFPDSVLRETYKGEL